MGKALTYLPQLGVTIRDCFRQISSIGTSTSEPATYTDLRSNDNIPSITIQSSVKSNMYLKVTIWDHQVFKITKQNSSYALNIRVNFYDYISGNLIQSADYHSTVGILSGYYACEHQSSGNFQLTSLPIFSKILQ